MSNFRARRHGKELKDPKLVPSSSVDALKIAMRLESIPAQQYDDLLWIMTQESVGIPGVENGSTTASGLFQMNEAARQAFYPRGDASVGNAIEEAQGAIRYMLSRYGSAAEARRFWDIHHWW